MGGLRFRQPRSPYMFLAIPLLVGALLGGLLVWVLSRPDPSDRVPVDYVAGTASVDRRGRTVTLSDEEGQLIGRLQITQAVSGRKRCLPKNAENVRVVVGVVHIDADEENPQPRDMLISVRCEDQPG